MKGASGPMTDTVDQVAESGGAPHRVVDAPLAPPSSDQGLVGVFKRRYLLRLLVRREVSARYLGSFLGLMWSYINPLSQFLIYCFVFGRSSSCTRPSRTSRSTSSRRWCSSTTSPRR